VSLLTASNARLLLVAYPRRVSETTGLKFVLEGATIIRIHGTTRSLFGVRGDECIYDVRPLLAMINSESLPKFNIEGVIIDR